jgi:hypothetical protein
MRADFIPTTRPPNISRLLEDMTSVMSWMRNQRERGRPLPVPVTPLKMLGRSFTGSDAFSGRPESIRTDAEQHRQLASQLFVLPDSAQLELSFLVVAVYLADIGDGVETIDSFDILRWLFTVGATKYSLYPFLPKKLLLGLRARTIVTAKHPISPLEWFVLRSHEEVADRAKMRLGPEQCAAGAKVWLFEYGIARHNLFWLIASDELAGLSAGDLGLTGFRHAALLTRSGITTAGILRSG